MTYLELVQRAIRESGAHLNVPADFNDLDGMQNNFLRWVADAWNEIQMERTDWFFRNRENGAELDPFVLDEGVLVPPEEIAEEYLQAWKSLPIMEVWIEEITHEGYYVANGDDIELFVADGEGFHVTVPAY